MKKDYKVEAKGSLFEVSFEKGCYSDWDIKYRLFSGNSEEEVWEFIKIWASQGGINKYRCGLVWNDRKFQFKEIEDWRKETEEEMDWDTEYGDALKVNIHRANVIYVNPNKLLKDTIIRKAGD